MLKYIGECKKKYVKGNEIGYVTCVYSGVKKHAGRERLAERGIKAMLQLAQKRGLSTPITVDELSEQSGIDSQSDSDPGFVAMATSWHRRLCDTRRFLFPLRKSSG